MLDFHTMQAAAIIFLVLDDLISAPGHTKSLPLVIAGCGSIQFYECCECCSFLNIL
jgi:hypothetical protein